MADGHYRARTGTSASSSFQFTSDRQLPYVITSLYTFILFIAGTTFFYFSPQKILDGIYIRLGLATLFSVSLILGLLLARDSEDNFQHGPKLLLPTMCVILLSTLTSIVVYLNTSKDLYFIPWIPPSAFELSFYILLGIFTSLAPLAVNAVIFSGYRAKAKMQIHEKNDSNKNLVSVESENAEAIGALFATVVVFSLSALAVIAAKWGGTFQLQPLYGVGLSGFVVGIFAIVVFLEPLSQLPLIRWLGRTLKWLSARTRILALFYNAIDSVLVKVGSGMAGMEHRNIWSRYVFLSSILTCLSVLGWFLPSPLGLIPSTLALTLAISVSRLWSWVEEDRALAALTNFNRNAPYKTELREDFRDETLLGFIFVFGLMPIIMYQMHHAPYYSPDGLFHVSENQQHSFLAWLGFFGIELAKAVPIVDWAEIYQVGQNSKNSMISMDDPMSRHLVFLSRVTVDLVLIAALIQAISISSRNRQQKRLYNAGLDRKNLYRKGLIDRLDAFVERVEVRKAISEVQRPNSPKPDKNTSGEVADKQIFDLTKLQNPDLIDFRRYNIERLQELHKSSNVKVRAFVSAIEHQRPDFDLKSPIELLELMAEQNRGESDLYRIQSKLIENYLENPLNTDISVEALRAILLNTRHRTGLEQFKLKIIEFWGIVAINGSKEDADRSIEFLADIAGISDPDNFQYTKTAAVVRMADIAIKRNKTPELNEVIRLLDLLKLNTDQRKVLKAIDGASMRVKDLLRKKAGV